jgi:hypothetical protein
MGRAPVCYILGLLSFGLILAKFPHVLNVIREPLLGSPCSHILYHTPTNGLNVTSAHILLRFVRLQVSDTGSPRVRGTMQAIFAMESKKSGSAGPTRDIGKVLIVGESRA